MEAFFSSDSVKIITVLLTMITTATLIYQRLKQINHSNKSVKMSQIDLYMKIRKESLEDRLSVELMFQHLFNKAIPYDEICLLFQMNSPSLAIQDYLRGNDFVKIEDGSIVFKKVKHAKRLKIFEYLYITTYFFFAFASITLILLVLFVEKEFLPILFLYLVLSIVISIICLYETSKIRSARRATKYVVLAENEQKHQTAKSE